MVQYILTPWRDRQELLLVRHQFYGYGPDAADAAAGAPGAPGAPGDGDGGEGHDDDAAAADGRQRLRQTQTSTAARRARLHQAVARASMWMQRGNCPHMVESTALLTSAVLSDEEAGDDGRAASSAYASRAAYSAAFSRFVTGLLDGQQDKLRKQSMYSLAKTIGLPATFVELRHQATHEQLPSLAKLRSAAQKALAWIWEYYWQHLGPETASSSSSAAPTSKGSERTSDAAGCEAAVLHFLTLDMDDEQGHGALRELRAAWDPEELLRCLAGLQGRLPGNQAQIKCLRLSKELMKEQHDNEGRPTEIDVPGQDGQPSAGEARVVTAPESDSASETGWSMYQGPWKPKPIGMV